MALPLCVDSQNVLMSKSCNSNDDWVQDSMQVF